MHPSTAITQQWISVSSNTYTCFHFVHSWHWAFCGYSTYFNLFTESHFESLNSCCWPVRQINDPNRTWHSGTPQAAQLMTSPLILIICHLWIHFPGLRCFGCMLICHESHLNRELEVPDQSRTASLYNCPPCPAAGLHRFKTRNSFNKGMNRIVWRWDDN